MIKVTIFRNSEGEAIGFQLNGHAGYSEYGTDIVCAGASVLAQNMVNSIEAFTDDKFTLDIDENSGLLKFTFEESSSSEAQLLINSFILGINSIIESGNEKYISIKYKEV